jgi:3-phenylpropionate/trans-cinnamate dioxygenase ferredoxin component
MTLHTVCSTNDLAVGDKRLVTVAGEAVLVYRLADGWYATQAKCPHILAPLAKGKLVEGHQVQCPFHRARFDVRTGRCVQWANWPPGLVNVLNAFRGEKDLRTWPVRITGDQVQVETA